MSFLSKLFRKGEAADRRSKEQPLTIEGMHVAVEQVRYLFVILESDAVGRLAAGKSQRELQTLAVSLAYALWDESSVTRCVETSGRLVSMAGTEVVNKTSALDCVKRNFSAVSDCEFFAVKEGRLATGGKAALVLALSSPPKNISA